MKLIAITANTSWYLYNFRKNTISNLISKGFIVIVISPSDNYSPRLKNLGCEHIHISIDQNGNNIINDLLTIMTFYKIYKRIKPNVVLNFTTKNNIYSTFSAYLNNIRVINNISGLGINFSKKSFTFYILKYLYKISQPLADVIFFQNMDDMKVFSKYNIANKVKKYQVIGSGVDLSRFSFSPTKKKIKINFLLSARLITEKGIYFYFDAASYFKNKYDNVEFYLAGFIDSNNPTSINIKKLEELQSKKIINYLGMSDTIEEIIKNMDCIVLPSYYSEGVPKSLLEAAAMGKPIITTDNTGCRDVVDNNFNGFLVKPRSLNSLINGISKFIDLSQEEQLRMGINSRKKAEKSFDENIIINKYLSVIDKFFI
jgi:glycosyltransferase involved in cell wall biosynthesis